MVDWFRYAAHTAAPAYGTRTGYGTRTAYGNHYTVIQPITTTRAFSCYPLYVSLILSWVCEGAWLFFAVFEIWFAMSSRRRSPCVLAPATPLMMMEQVLVTWSVSLSWSSAAGLNPKTWPRLAAVRPCWSAFEKRRKKTNLLPCALSAHWSLRLFPLQSRQWLRLKVLPVQPILRFFRRIR